MTDIRKKPSVEKLELNKETVQDLTQRQSEAVEGGDRLQRSRRLGCGTLDCPRTKTCPTLKFDCRLA